MDTYSMFKKIKINYDDIVEKEKIIVNYIVQSSDTFSIIPIIQKPYSQDPPVFDYCECFYSFADKYIFDRNAWLTDFSGKLKHQIMVVCRCNKKSRNVLMNLPNLFLPAENNLPEDLCCYRKEELWFGTISHEKIAFFTNATDDDITFLKSNNIKYFEVI